MKNTILKRLTATALIILILFCNVTFVSASQGETKIKNIIYMIPDGGGMAPFFLSDYVKQEGGIDEKLPNATPTNAEEMYLKKYLVGAETTHSANASVTDSAASGTALSSGYKTNNGMIGVTPQLKPRANILEACQRLGKNTGIVVTYEWTNATPAAFSAHAENRTEALTIGEQVVNQGIDVVFGNTISSYNNQTWFTNAAFEERGYKVISSESQLADVKAGDKLWGKLPAAYYDYTLAATTPNLAELTTAAIKALDDDNENGFFLMVEGSAVDGGGHSSDALKMVSEWLAFDEACKVAIEYAKKRDDTLVVVLPDHDTGGLKYGNTYTSASLEPLTDEILNGINPAGTTWEGNGSHTARNGGVFMYVPDGVPYPSGIDKTKFADVLSAFQNDFRTCSINQIDNTAIANYLADILGIDMDKLTEELFVDVTEMGSYNSSTEMFTLPLSTGTIEIKRNTSVATVDGEEVDLDGQVAVYINGNFYVPKILLPLKDPSISIYADYNKKQVSINGVTEWPCDYITFLVTEPGNDLAESIAENKVVYIGQESSDTNNLYDISFNIPNRTLGDYKYYARLGKGDNIEEYAFCFKNITVLKDNAPINNIEQLDCGDTIRLALNGFGSSHDGVAIIAQYDNNGVVIDMKAESIQGGADDPSSEDYIEATVKNNVTKIKAFYWNKLNNIPFAGVYVVE